MQRFGTKFIVVMILLCGITGILAGFNGNTVNQRGSEHKKENLREQLELLYSLGETQIVSPLHVTAKLQGESGLLNSKTKEEVIQALTYEIGFNEVIVEIENENQAYRARDVILGIDIRMDWVQSGDQVYVKIQLDTEGTDGFTSLLDIQNKSLSILEEAGMNPAWNASVQGNVDNGLSAGETIQNVEEQLATHLSFNPVEFYQDMGTESRAYEVPSLTNYVMSGKNPIHMQVAVHEDSMHKNNRVTIGFPVITTEY
ncbi:YwmB family TATA-box binding protein [Paenibacillus sp. GCM10028914]|uniref:YwmB family TATA-box binding protein n=1 Tax=Paenibacillus sp. GCM10028914 TaxID=3273416 RepID=UPI00360CDA85